MMKKVLKDLKNNKYTTICLILFVILIIAGFISYKIFFPSNGKPLYGNRLDGIEEVSLDNEQLNEIKNTLKEQKIVTDVETDIKGRIINIIITVKEDTKLVDAKKLTSIFMTKIEEKQKKYLDIQVFLKNEKENIDGYPTIGYMGKDETEFKYSSATYETED